MAFKKTSPELYQCMVDAYRECGTFPNHAKVGRTCGVDRGTAQAYYERGNKVLGFAPIHEVLAQELVGRRALRAQEKIKAAKRKVDETLAEAKRQAEEQVREMMAAAELEVLRKLEVAEAAGHEALAKAEKEADLRLRAAEQKAQEKVEQVYSRMRLDAAEQQAEEILLSKSARKNTLQAHGFMALVWANARQIAQQLKDSIDKGQLTPKQLVVLMREMTTASKNVAQASKVAIELERLRVGDPTEHTKVTIETATLDEAEESVAQAASMLELVRRRQQAQGGEPIEVEEAAADPVPPPTGGSN